MSDSPQMRPDEPELPFVPPPGVGEEFFIEKVLGEKAVDNGAVPSNFSGKQAADVQMELPIDADREDNIVYMALVRAEATEDGGMHIVSTPVAYNLEDGAEVGARPLSDAEAPPEIAQFYENVADDMDALSLSLITRSIASQLPKHEVFMRLLMDMQGQPVELIHNMLAVSLVEAMDSVAESLAEADKADPA